MKIDMKFIQWANILGWSDEKLSEKNAFEIVNYIKITQSQLALGPNRNKKKSGKIQNYIPVRWILLVQIPRKNTKITWNGYVLFYFI